MVPFSLSAAEWPVWPRPMRPTQAFHREGGLGGMGMPSWGAASPPPPGRWAGVWVNPPPTTALRKEEFRSANGEFAPPEVLEGRC